MERSFLQNPGPCEFQRLPATFWPPSGSVRLRLWRVFPVGESVETLGESTVTSDEFHSAFDAPFPKGRGQINQRLPSEQRCQWRGVPTESVSHGQQFRASQRNSHPD